MTKELMKTHSKYDTQTIKDNSTWIGTNTIQNYPSSTGISKREIPTQS